jgi:hypothetical protein
MQYFHTDDALVFGTFSVEQMRIDSSGRLLVGASSASLSNSLVEIEGSSNANFLSILNNSASDADGNRYSKLLFRGTHSGGGQATLCSVQSAHDGSANDEKGRLTLHTNDGNDSDSPTERMRIDSSGNVGIGTTSIDNKLHIASDISAVVKYECTSGTSTYTKFENTDNARGFVGYEGKRLVFYADNGLNTGDIRVAFMDADGLKFKGDTAAANALDDYEEGDWTPYFTSGGVTSPFVSNLFTSYGYQQGRYTKIGRHVYLTAFLELSATTYANGGADNQDLGIAGLPFATDNSQTYPSISVGWFNHWSGWSTGYTPMGYVENNSSYIKMTYAAANGIDRIKSNHVQTTSAGILISLHYCV